MTTQPKKSPPPLRIMQKEPPKPPASEPMRAGRTLDWSNIPALTPDGHAEWERLAVEFATDPGRFREGDRAAVEAYCSYAADFSEACRLIQAEGLVVAGRSSADQAAGHLVKNPAVTLKTGASSQLRYWARELGLTPNARAQMKIRPADDEATADDNPF